MTLDLCIEAVEEALARHGTPEIFDSGQGSEFARTAFVQAIGVRGERIGMDGKGRWRHSRGAERLWRSVKHEAVSLRACDRVAGDGLQRYFVFHNTRWSHATLNQGTPDQACFAPLPLPEAA